MNVFPLAIGAWTATVPGLFAIGLKLVGRIPNLTSKLRIQEDTHHTTGSTSLPET